MRDDVLIDSETFLVIDFVNIKIKLAQSFKYAYRDKVYIRVFICVSVYVYEYLFVLCFSKKWLGMFASVFN
jgi:hypothetical protein